MIQKVGGIRAGHIAAKPREIGFHSQRLHNGSGLISEGLSVCPLWGSRKWGRRRAGIRVISGNPKELKVPIQLVIESVVSVGRLEILPVFLTEDAEVVRGHGVPAEVGHGLEVLVERWLSEFGWWDRSHSSDSWEDLITTSLACKNESQ